VRCYSVAGYALHACPECRLEFLAPQPDDSVLAGLYGDCYFLGGHGAGPAERRAQMKSATGALYLDALARLVRPEEARLLEIGCGQGEVLVEARKRGFTVSGIEISSHAAGMANSRLQEQAVCVGSLDQAALPAGRFDAILAADVIEHVRDPKAFLDRVHQLLIPGGAVLLVTPSLDSWTRRLLRSRWMEYKIEHLYYFSAASLRLLLEKCGFIEIRVFPNRKVLTFDYVWRHFERFRVPLLSPLLGVARWAMPDRLAYRQTRVAASGLMAIAKAPFVK